MLKMFNLIDIGKRTGSGIPNIFRVWQKQGWAVPAITESFDPDRIMLSLALKKNDDKNGTTKERNHHVSYQSMFLQII